MMKFHEITGGRPKVVSAVTLPDRVVRATTNRSMADRVYDGYEWYEAPNSYDLTAGGSPAVLITFSDDTLGVTSEGRLGDALAAYDVSLEPVSS